MVNLAVPVQVNKCAHDYRKHEGEEDLQGPTSSPIYLAVLLIEQCALADVAALAVASVAAAIGVVDQALAVRVLGARLIQVPPRPAVVGVLVFVKSLAAPAQALVARGVGAIAVFHVVARLPGFDASSAAGDILSCHQDSTKKWFAAADGVAAVRIDVVRLAVLVARTALPKLDTFVAGRVVAAELW